MESKSLNLWAAVLLLVGGLVHLIPSLYSGLAELTDGVPWIQVVVGILSVIVALVMFAGDKQAENKESGSQGFSSPAEGTEKKQEENKEDSF